VPMMRDKIARPTAGFPSLFTRHFARTELI